LYYLDLFCGSLRTIVINQRGAAYLPGAIFIVFDFNLGFYKPTIAVLAFSVLLDVAGLLCNTI
jgi:hypothetical protein